MGTKNYCKAIFKRSHVEKQKLIKNKLKTIK